MTIYAIFRTESDDYTYSSEAMIGFGLTQEEAEALLLGHVERMANLKALHKQYEAERDVAAKEFRTATAKQVSSAPNDRKAQKALDQDPLTIFRAKLAATREAYKDSLEDFNNMTSSKLEDYEIRPVESGTIY